jgi:hypothetical protein
LAAVALLLKTALREGQAMAAHQWPAGYSFRQGTAQGLAGPGGFFLASPSARSTCEEICVLSR